MPDEVLAAARRLGPLPWSDLGGRPAPPLPPCAPAALAAAVGGWWAATGRPDPLPVVVAGAAAAPLVERVLAGRAAARPGWVAATRWLVVAPGGTHLELGDVPVEEPAVVLGPAVTADDPDEPPAPAPGTGPAAALVADLPAGLAVAVVVAAGLLDGLPADRYVRRSHGWAEARLAAAGTGLVEVLVDAGAGPPGLPPPGPGAPERWEDPIGARRWLRAARSVAASGVVLAAGAAPPPAGLDAGPWPHPGGSLCPSLHLAAWSMRGDAT